MRIVFLILLAACMDHDVTLAPKDIWKIISNTLMMIVMKTWDTLTLLKKISIRFGIA